MTAREERDKAIAAGEKHYKGRVCKHGHDDGTGHSVRFVSSSECCECKSTRVWTPRRYEQQYHHNRTERRKKYMREYMRRYAETHPGYRDAKKKMDKELYERSKNEQTTTIQEQPTLHQGATQEV